MNHKRTSLTGALVTILVSCFLGAAFMIGAGVYLAENRAYYFIAAVMFVVAGGIGFVVVRKLDEKINGVRR